MAIILFVALFYFTDTDIPPSTPGWKGRRLWGRILWNTSRSWKPAHAFCSPARPPSGSRQSSRKSWRSLYRPDTRTCSRPPRGRAGCGSCAAGTSRAGCSADWWTCGAEWDRRTLCDVNAYGHHRQWRTIDQTVPPSGSAHADTIDPWCSSGVKYTYCTPETSNKDVLIQYQNMLPILLQCTWSDSWYKTMWFCSGSLVW